MQIFTYMITLIIGAILGGALVRWFNVPDTVINGKNKVKNGGKIDFKTLFKRKK